MYDELVKRLRSEAVYLPEKFSKNAELLDVLMKAADAIEDLSKARWIPVTERLPETPGEYIVAYHPCYWDHVHDEIKVGLDSFRGKTSWAKKKHQRVTHWMPLPEPPKEE